MHTPTSLVYDIQVTGSSTLPYEVRRPSRNTWGYELIAACESKEHAALIVQAVNAHERLVNLALAVAAEPTHLGFAARVLLAELEGKE